MLVSKKARTAHHSRRSGARRQARRHAGRAIVRRRARSRLRDDAARTRPPPCESPPAERSLLGRLDWERASSNRDFVDAHHGAFLESAATLSEHAVECVRNPFGSHIAQAEYHSARQIIAT